MSIELKLHGLKGFVSEEEIAKQQGLTEFGEQILMSRSGAGNDFLGWIDLPHDYDKDEFERMKAAAAKVQKNSEAFVVIGIGGSYLGARAALEFVKGPFYNNMKKDTPDVYFVGNNISSSYLNDVVDLVKDRNFSVNVISKSGTTTESAIAFRVFKKLLEEKYGKEGAKERIFATTDKARGTLKALCDSEGYETFVIPDDVGGRFSVLTPVGILPLAVAGLDVDAMMKGAADASTEYRTKPYAENNCMKYAALRHIMNNRGKAAEILINYEPYLVMFGEWYKQLFAESQGKDGKGVFPTAANLSTDLHSIGQYIQDGPDMFFETVLWVNNSQRDYVVEEDADNIDGLNFLAGKTMQYINSKAFNGTLLAHMDGGNPNIVIEIPNNDEYHFGQLVYFFEKACGVGGYMLGINPFDQPGVEAYKRNMFGLLNKPGYESLHDELEKKLK